MIKTHGKSRTTEYEIWKSMKKRCDNSNCDAYYRYGDRGISYDERWKYFENFYNDMGDRLPGTTLDRKDNDGNYCKENCRWATPEEQQNNRSNNHLLFFKHEYKTIAEWSRVTGIKESTITERLKSGMSIKEALTKRVG